jgi:dynein heavy chain 2
MPPACACLQAQGESVIRKALTELKLWGLQREFAFLEAASGQQQGKQAGGVPKPDIPLVKEWQDLMTEVGDHQSLVASLKQSSYYNLFKVKAGGGKGSSPCHSCIMTGSNHAS